MRKDSVHDFKQRKLEGILIVRLIKLYPTKWISAYWWKPHRGSLCKQATKEWRSYTVPLISDDTDETSFCSRGLLCSFYRIFMALEGLHIKSIVQRWVGVPEMPRSQQRRMFGPEVRRERKFQRAKNHNFRQLSWKTTRDKKKVHWVMAETPRYAENRWLTGEGKRENR